MESTKEKDRLATHFLEQITIGKRKITGPGRALENNKNTK
jgi:hypothetical protein